MIDQLGQKPTHTATLLGDGVCMHIERKQASLPWQRKITHVRGHTSENAAEAGTGTANEAGAVLYRKMLKSPHVATEVAAETDSVPNAIPALTKADLLTLLHGKPQEAIQKTGLQVNRTEMLSEAASTPDLTVGT